MADGIQDIGRGSRGGRARRRLSWLLALLPALLAAVWLAPTPAQAGTVTIVDGAAATQPVNGVYTDGYIQNYLTITGSLSISTTGVVTGPDEIRVLQGAVITWTTGNQLTLDAGSSMVITGVIQHNGPTIGLGGLRLLVSTSPTGTVTLGPGTQTTGVAAGSRFGQTRVVAGNLVLRGGASGAEPYAQLGYHTVDQGAAYTVTGFIGVTLGQSVTASAGAASQAYVQIGHGGGDSSPFDGVASGNFSGVVGLAVKGNAIFQGGAGLSAYAQLGHGGTGAIGNHNGTIVLATNGDTTFRAGGSNQAYAHMGNGGWFAGGNHTGAVFLAAAGDITFQSGGFQTYAQFGNGGYDADGNHSGDQRLDAEGDVVLQSSNGLNAYTLFGNGGYLSNGNHSGNHSLVADGEVTLQAGSNSSTFVQFGNGGLGATGNQSGNHTLTAGADVSFLAGSSGGAYVQMGNGGFGANGSDSGSLTLTTGGGLGMTRGSGVDAYAMIGHGSDVRTFPANQSTGNRAGDISLSIGERAVFNSSHAGHLSATGVAAVTQGKTLIGVSQNDPLPTGTGEFQVTGVTTTTFSSAPTANGGELRIYLPRADSQLVPLNTTFNGKSFAVANTIPAAQLAGYASFGEGPYIPDYSFYLGGQPDVGIGKTAAPAGPFIPGDTLTYTLSFSNTGTATATNVIISDTAPALAAFIGITPDPDAGVLITQTGAAPNTAWAVSALGPGKGGRIVISTIVQPVNTPPPPTVVEARNNFFTPTPITVTVGSTVRWNRIQGTHNIVADDDSFTNGPVSGAWSSFEHTFISAGSFPYHCALHGADGGIGMAGVVTVVAGPTPSVAFTNTATITATGDITLSNNSASVTRGVIPLASISITKTVVGTAPAADWPFSGSGAIGDFSIPVAGGSVTIGGLVPTTYALTETAKPGYTAAVVCTTGQSGTSSVQVTLPPGQQVGCTFTNTFIPPVVTQTLTVNKVVVGGPLDADDFPLFVDNAPVTRGVPKQLSAGQHTVSETGVSTYTAAFGGACNAAGVVNLASGAHVTCTITNTFVPPVVITQTLTVNKVVVGGPLGADDFDLFVDGAPVTRGVANQFSVGQHTVSETGVSTYTAAFGGACNANGQVNLASGSHVTCTITNTFTPEPPQTGGVEGLVYVDENGNNQPDTGEGLQGVTVTLQSETGVAAALTLTDTTDSDGEYGFTDVPVGDYTLSFQPPAGYEAIGNAQVTVTAGQTTQAPNRIAVPVGPPDTLGDVFLPVLQR